MASGNFCFSVFDMGHADKGLEDSTNLRAFCVWKRSIGDKRRNRSKRNKTKSSGYAGVLYGKRRKKRNIGRVSKGVLHSVPKFELEHEGKVEKQGNKTGGFY